LGLSQFSRDSPENGLKIVCAKTGLKCSAIIRISSIKSNWYHHLAATLRIYCTNICARGTATLQNHSLYKVTTVTTIHSNINLAVVLN
jgi:hypothetical protein